MCYNIQGAPILLSENAAGSAATNVSGGTTVIPMPQEKSGSLQTGSTVVLGEGGTSSKPPPGTTVPRDPADTVGVAQNSLGGAADGENLLQTKFNGCGTKNPNPDALDRGGYYFWNSCTKNALISYSFICF